MFSGNGRRALPRGTVSHPPTHCFWNYLPPVTIITLRPSRNEQHFADDIFKRIFFNENVWISIKISLKFVLKGPINNIPALVQIMAWRRPGDKPLSEPMMVRLLMHICWDYYTIVVSDICFTRPQWVMHAIPAKLWNIWKAHWEHSYLTVWFTGNGLAPTTNKYCGLNATLACSVMDENAGEMFGEVLRKLWTFLKILMCILNIGHCKLYFSSITPRESGIKVTILVCGCYQAISSKSRCQIWVFPLCFPNNPYILPVVYHQLISH